MTDRFHEYLDLMRRVERYKGKTYGSAKDPIINYTRAGSLFGDPACKVMLQRVEEKVLRAANAIGRGDPIAMDDAIDIAIIILKAQAASEIAAGRPAPPYVVGDEDEQRVPVGMIAQIPEGSPVPPGWTKIDLDPGMSDPLFRIEDSDGIDVTAIGDAAPSEVTGVPGCTCGNAAGLPDGSVYHSRGCPRWSYYKEAAGRG